MSSKVDITHTVALKNRPHPDARLIRDLDTGEAVWEGDEPVPKVDLIAARNADVDAAFAVEEKRLLKEALEPVVEPAVTSRTKKRVIHG